jgi:hypothetical protein
MELEEKMVLHFGGTHGHRVRIVDYVVTVTRNLVF